MFYVISLIIFYCKMKKKLAFSISSNSIIFTWVVIVKIKFEPF